MSLKNLEELAKREEYFVCEILKRENDTPVCETIRKTWMSLSKKSNFSATLDSNIPLGRKCLISKDTSKTHSCLQWVGFQDKMKT